MKKKLILILILYSFSLNCASLKEQYPFSKVIIWGHKFKTKHSHAWIHWAFFRAFKHLGYDTYWLDNDDSVDHLDLNNALFITEGQADQKIPLNYTSKYILHNCDGHKYTPLFKRGNCITLQVFTNDVLERDVQEVQPFIYYDLPGKIVYMPWATDLLPHEINEKKKKVAYTHKKNIVYWIGSLSKGSFGNIDEISSFKKACAENGIRIVHHGGVDSNDMISMEQNAALIQESYMAPAIVGTWQEKQGYIPCRIFKNISYGQMGITNSKTTYDIFDGKIVYNPDTYQLFYDAKEKIEHMDTQELYDLMDFVRDNHTYINRIKHLLNFLKITSSS